MNPLVEQALELVWNAAVASPLSAVAVTAAALWLVISYQVGEELRLSAKRKRERH